MVSVADLEGGSMSWLILWDCCRVQLVVLRNCKPNSPT